MSDSVLFNSEGIVPALVIQIYNAAREPVTLAGCLLRLIFGPSLVAFNQGRLPSRRMFALQVKNLTSQDRSNFPLRFINLR